MMADIVLALLGFALIGLSAIPQIVFLIRKGGKSAICPASTRLWLIIAIPMSEAKISCAAVSGV